MQQPIKRSMTNDHSRMRVDTLNAGPPKSDIPLSADFSDKREFPRDPAQDLSEIIIAGQKHGIACMIRDISASGAKLEVSCSELPGRFVLANYTKRTKTICRQIWRENRLVGVKFLSSPRPFSLEERL